MSMKVIKPAVWSQDWFTCWSIMYWLKAPFFLHEIAKIKLHFPKYLLTPRFKQSDIRVKLGEYDFEQVFLLSFHIRKSSELFSPLLFTGRWNEGPNFYACVNEDSREIRRRHFRERYCNPQTERSRHKVRKDIDINFTPKTYLNSTSRIQSI